MKQTKKHATHKQPKNKQTKQKHTKNPKNDPKIKPQINENKFTQNHLTYTYNNYPIAANTLQTLF